MIGRQVDRAYPHAVAPARAEVALAASGLSGGAVDQISFDLNKGEIVGLAGLAGAGQSDVLRLVMGAEPARAGHIQIGDHVGRPHGLAAAWQSGLAYVPRERRSEGLVLSRPIVENISLAHLDRFSRGGVFLARRRERAVADQRGAEVRLKARGTHQLCQELSGGNQQKVVFAKALSGEPQVLLLDEPTRGVDVGAKFDIYSLIREWSANGMAVLIASSDFPELLGMCDRIIVMRHGAIATILDTAGLSEETLLGHCYGPAAMVSKTAAAGEPVS
jgi:ribose transport system ATP-binding protein